MTEFVGVDNLARWAKSRGISDILRELTEHIEADFLRWPVFGKTERIASHTPFGVIELMPINDADRYSFKYVNGHPSNPARGFQTVTAFGVLADVHNGYPIFMAEMTLLTAMRTAATSAMVARRLARSDSSVMAMIGAGSQAEFQALAIREACGISRLQVYDVDPLAVRKLQRNLVPLGFEVTAHDSAASATRGSDVITTCTADKVNAQVLSLEDVPAGTHVNAIGGDCPGKTELDPRLLEAGKVFVEYPPQTRIEGEVQNMAPDFPVTEFWEVVAGSAEGRESSKQITIFDSVGFAIEDFSALTYLRASVAGSDFVTDIDLIARPDDPKDLFGMIGAPVLV